VTDSRSMSLWWTWGILGAGVAALPLHAAHADEGLARITITLEVDGSESERAGSDWGKATIAERYHVVTTVKTDGVLSSVNMKDPQYHEKALAQANRDRARMRAAQERVARRRRAAGRGSGRGGRTARRDAGRRRGVRRRGVQAVRRPHVRDAPGVRGRDGRARAARVRVQAVRRR
jgi:hypothetical protein